MEFRVGQMVKLVKAHGMGAELGATAVILRKNGEFIIVSWKTHFNNQAPGSYYSTRFEPVAMKNQQLLFSFME